MYRPTADSSRALREKEVPPNIVEANKDIVGQHVRGEQQSN